MEENDRQVNREDQKTPVTPPEPALSTGASKWAWSDKLAVALACLAGLMALALLWMEKTPIWAGTTIVAMLLFVVYPVLHFVPSWKARIPVWIIAWIAIGCFGWKIWPIKKSAPPPAAKVSPSSTNTNSSLGSPSAQGTPPLHGPKSGGNVRKTRNHNLLPASVVGPPASAIPATSAVPPVVVAPGGAVSFNQQGGITAGTVNIQTPPLTITWSVRNEAGGNDSWKFEKIVTVTPNVEWHPVSVAIFCDQEIKAVMPEGVFYGLRTGQDTTRKVVAIYFPNPPQAANTSISFEVFSDQEFNVLDVKLSAPPPMQQQ